MIGGPCNPLPMLSWWCGDCGAVAQIAANKEFALPAHVGSPLARQGLVLPGVRPRGATISAPPCVRSPICGGDSYRMTRESVNGTAANRATAPRPERADAAPRATLPLRPPSEPQANRRWDDLSTPGCAISGSPSRNRPDVVAPPGRIVSMRMGQYWCQCTRTVIKMYWYNVGNARPVRSDTGGTALLMVGKAP
jgi:hypothetical protein